MNISRNWIENLIIAGILVLFLSLTSSCGANFFTANTTASYELPNGEKLLYSSNKDQQGFKVHMGAGPDGKLRILDIETTAATPEAAIAAAMQSMAKLVDTLNALVSQLAATAKAGALAGS